MLTSHSCSEEGLEDAANVLLQLSRGDPGTRDTVLRLLLSGARQLGATLCRQIGGSNPPPFHPITVTPNFGGSPEVAPLSPPPPPCRHAAG